MSGRRSAPPPSSPNGADGGPFAAAVGALRHLATAPSPDARLIAACDRVMWLHEQREMLYRMQRPNFMAQCRALRAEYDQLEEEIIVTPARTAAGVRIKAETALALMPSRGTLWDLFRSTLRDIAIRSGDDLGPEDVQ